MIWAIARSPAQMAEEEEQLLRELRQAASAGQSVPQAWYARAYEFLDSRLEPPGHWWCGHNEMTAALLELLPHYDSQPSVRAIYDSLAGQLESCSACVNAHHDAKARTLTSG